MVIETKYSTMRLNIQTVFFAAGFVLANAFVNPTQTAAVSYFRIRLCFDSCSLEKWNSINDFSVPSFPESFDDSHFLSVVL